MKVYTKKKRNKLSAAWLGFDGDRLYLKGKRKRFPNIRQGVYKALLNRNLFIEVYIHKRSYFVIV